MAASERTKMAGRLSVVALTPCKTVHTSSGTKHNPNKYLADKFAGYGNSHAVIRFGVFINSFSPRAAG